jgi:hypothetical protein
VNVTLVPAQIAPEGEAVTLTEGVTDGFTVIVIPADVTLVGEAQAAFEVITTVITGLPAESDVVVKVALVAPGTFVPLICH